MGAMCSCQKVSIWNERCSTLVIPLILRVKAAKAGYPRPVSNRILFRIVDDPGNKGNVVDNIFTTHQFWNGQKTVKTLTTAVNKLHLVVHNWLLLPASFLLQKRFKIIITVLTTKVKNVVKLPSVIKNYIIFTV